MKTLLSVCALAAMLLSSGRGSAEGDTGYLDIASDPQGAKILIDDKDTGRTTPQSHLPLAVGHHKLLLVTPDEKHRRGLGFTVEADHQAHHPPGLLTTWPPGPHPGQGASLARP
jgi:hypothetical protein